MQRIEAEILSDTHVAVEAEALLDALADTLAEIAADKLLRECG